MEMSVKENRKSGQRDDHPLRKTIVALEVSRTEIARRYRCSVSFVHAVLSGKFPCPPKLEALMREMIEERRRHLASVLNDLEDPT